MSQAWNLNATTGINFRNQLSNDANYNRYLISHSRYTSAKTVASVVSFSPATSPAGYPGDADYAMNQNTSNVFYAIAASDTNISGAKSLKAPLNLVYTSKLNSLFNKDPTLGPNSNYRAWMYFQLKFEGHNALEIPKPGIDGSPSRNWSFNDLTGRSSMTTTAVEQYFGIKSNRYSKLTIYAKCHAETRSTMTAAKLAGETLITWEINGTAPTTPGSDPVIGRRDAAAFSDYDVASHTGTSHSTQLLCDDDGKLINCYARDTGVLSQWNISRFRYHDESSNYTSSTNMQDTGYTSDIVGDGTHASLQNWSFATSQTFGSSVDPQTSTTTTGTVWGNFSNYLLYAQYKPTNLISQYGKAGDTTTYHAINNNLEIYNNGGALTYTTVPATSLDQTITGYYFDNTNKVIKSGNVTLKSPQIKLPNHTLKAKDAKIYEFFTPNLTDKNKDPIHMGEGFLLGYNDKEYQNAKVKLSFKLVNESGAVQASKNIDYLISDKKFDKCELAAGATQYNSTTTCTTDTSGIVDVTVPIGNTPEHAEIWLNACAQDTGLIVLIENLEIN